MVFQVFRSFNLWLHTTVRLLLLLFAFFSIGVNLDPLRFPNVVRPIQKSVRYASLTCHPLWWRDLSVTIVSVHNAGASISLPRLLLRVRKNNNWSYFYFTQMGLKSLFLEKGNWKSLKCYCDLSLMNMFCVLIAIS